MVGAVMRTTATAHTADMGPIPPGAPRTTASARAAGGAPWIATAAAASAADCTHGWGRSCGPASLQQASTSKRAGRCGRPALLIHRLGTSPPAAMMSVPTMTAGSEVEAESRSVAVAPVAAIVAAVARTAAIPAAAVVDVLCGGGPVIQLLCGKGRGMGGCPRRHCHKCQSCKRCALQHAYLSLSVFRCQF